MTLNCGYTNVIADTYGWNTSINSYHINLCSFLNNPWKTIILITGKRSLQSVSVEEMFMVLSFLLQWNSFTAV